MLQYHNMSKKIVIGLTGDNDTLKSKVTKTFVDIGFHKVSVSSKVKEFAKYLLPGNVFPEETLQGIRERGYNVNKCYWINLVLASVPDNKELIIIDDLQSEDIIDGVVISYEVVDQKHIKSDHTINGESTDLQSEIHGKIKKIASK